MYHETVGMKLRRCFGKEVFPEIDTSPKRATCTVLYQLREGFSFLGILETSHHEWLHGGDGGYKQS